MLKFIRFVVAIFGLAGATQTFAQNPTLTMADYGRLPQFETAVVSDNGKHIAMLLTIDGNRMVLVRKGETFIKKLTVGDEKVRSLRWGGNSHLLIETSQTEKLPNFNVDQAEFTRMLVVPMDNGPVETVFAKQSKIASSVFGVYGVRVLGGIPYLFAGGIPLEEDIYAAAKTYVFVGGKPQLFRINLKDMKVKRVDSDAFGDDWRRWLIDRSGAIAARLDLKKNSGQYKITNQKGEVIAQGNRPDGRIALTALGVDGGSVIYWTSDAEQARDSFMEVPLAGGEPIELLPDIDIDRLYRDRASGRLIGYLKGNTKPNDPDQRVFFDAATNAQISKVAKAFPNLNNRLESWSNNFGRVIIRTNGNGDSGSWFNVDLQNLSASALGYERMAITPEKVGKISTITYAAGDGLEIEAILTLPPGKEAKNLPVVVFPHGGPNAQDKPEFDWWAQAFASRGYAVLQPNFRGSTNRSRAFVQAGYGEWGRKMQTDLSDGLSDLAKQGMVDPKRACIMGASYGGYAALAGVTLQQDLYRCAISVAGVSDLSKMVSTDIKESGSNPMMKRNLQEQIGKGRDLKEVSPRRFAANANAPVLLIHGKDDIVVPYHQSYMMADALKDAGKPYSLVTLDGEDHWLSRSETRLKMLQAAIDFIEKHNPPG